MISTSTSAPTPSTSTARAVPLSLPTLLRELKALYPIPRKNQPTRRPNEAALDAFLAAVPHAAEGISESDDSSSRVGEELRGDSANGRSPIAWKMGRIALWALETMDGLVRELEVGLKAGGQSKPFLSRRRYTSLMLIFLFRSTSSTTLSVPSHPHPSIARPRARSPTSYASGFPGLATIYDFLGPQQ